MNPESPTHEPDQEAVYQIDVAARITGLSSETILEYQQSGFIRAKTSPATFEEADLLTLRRIHHLQQELGVNQEALRLILDLLEEVDRLKDSLRLLR